MWFTGKEHGLKADVTGGLFGRVGVDVVVVFGIGSVGPMGMVDGGCA